jgi:aldose 1-epimerase
MRTGLSEREAGSGKRIVNSGDFGIATDGQTVEWFSLSVPGGLRIRFMSLGGTILSIEAPDRNGVFADVALGFDTLDQYLGDSAFVGPIVGRYANRIANGRFTLDGRQYTLAKNNGPNHLHGGPLGFHRAHWKVTPHESGTDAVLEYESVDGEEGFPGRLNVRVSYSLTSQNDFVVDYYAIATAPTPINLTQHTYFNLAGEGSGDILGHALTVNAGAFTPVSATLIPTGEIRSVERTPFDFRTPRLIGERIDDDNEQLKHGAGYDHNFVLERGSHPGTTFAARVFEPTTGRILEIHTSEPGIQVYSGNSLPAKLPGKKGRAYGRCGGLALETQHFPDSPNQPAFPSTILRPGETFRSQTVYCFSTDRAREIAPTDRYVPESRL